MYPQAPHRAIFRQVHTSSAMMEFTKRIACMRTLWTVFSGVIPDDVLNFKRYIPLNLLSRNGLWRSIAVPSRLYFVRNPTTPLAGARMGIKDIFRLEGTQTTMMSRPWIELYGPNEQSADYTKKLIKLGAVIVGKTKMTSFASPEEPTDQWVDFHCPSAFWSLCYDYYHGFDSFRDEYSAKFGKKPFVSSVVRFRWDVGKDVTFQKYATYMKKLEVFRNWFTENVMGPDSKALSDAILMMPYGEPHPEYRDEANPSAGIFPTIAEKFISPILHAPQLVLPFAQMPYLSKVSGRLEMRPIASTMIGAKGSDLMLIKLDTEAFKKAGWPRSIQTGRYMYPVADNARNVGSVSGESLAAYETRQRAVQELQSEFGNKSSDFVCNAM
ncbi:related to D-mandelate dehydrogenase [Fusarium fujikuroi]|nr:Uncharacterized protein Y057_2809 [Fusarium fujikuroi]SCO43593.1 related to D-mandelate dehydrogenase [Fusarium fujikuroi]